MGLDMYLYAKRHFDPSSREAAEVLAAANVSIDQLREMSLNDPHQDETSIYLGRWDWYRADKRERAEAVLSAARLLSLGTDESCGGSLAWNDGKVVVSITCIYWRKANQVHSWFVHNCQGDVDECQESDEVHPEQLAHLRSLCLDALAAYHQGDLVKAGEIMAPRAGFFFGGTEVDEWWAEDLQRTVSEIDRVIHGAIEISGVTFNYQSSW